MARRFLAPLLIFLGIVAGTTAALGGAVTANASDEVREVHMHIVGDPSRYQLVWTTSEPFAWAVGTDNSAELRAAGGPGASASPLQTEGSDDSWVAWGEGFPWFRAVTVHEAEFENLAPGTTYAYRLPGGVEGTFRTPRTDEIAIGILADAAATEEASRNARALAVLDPELVLYAGDMAYADGNDETWRRWFDALSPVMSIAAFMAAPGNHEDEPFYGFQAYDSRFLHGRHYAFDAGPVRVVVLDSNDRESDVQTRWLEDELEAARGSGKWVVAMMHHLVRTSATWGTRVEGRYAHWEALFDRYEVDLVIQGHAHHYERTYPLRAGEPQTTARDGYARGTGTIYVTSGGAGAIPLHEFREDVQAWSAVRSTARQHAFMRVTEGRIELAAYSMDGALLDQFAIRRPR